MKPKSSLLACVLGAFALSIVTTDVSAQRGGGGRGGGGGGFSRGGMASGGGFAAGGAGVGGGAARAGGIGTGGQAGIGGGAAGAGRPGVGGQVGVGGGVVGPGNAATFNRRTDINYYGGYRGGTYYGAGCCWDAYNPDAVAGFVAGATVGAPPPVVVGEPEATLPCTPSVIWTAGGAYYRCGDAYYTQSYSGGSIVYTPVAPPPGY